MGKKRAGLKHAMGKLVAENKAGKKGAGQGGVCSDGKEDWGAPIQKGKNKGEVKGRRQPLCPGDLTAGGERRTEAVLEKGWREKTTRPGISKQRGTIQLSLIS